MMITLTEQLSERRAASAQRMSDALKTVMVGSLDALEEAGLAERALGVGDTAPDFVLFDAAGREIRLFDLLTTGPVVVSFYRGAWCPYCNLELRALQEALPALRAVGGTLVAISPNLPDTTMTVVERHDLEYPVLSDHDNAVARRFGLVFAVQDDLEAAYRAMGIDIGEANGTDPWEIPLPATYVISRDGTIAYAFVKTDYRLRAEPSDVVSVVAAI
jgi:peroxiredoxin